MNFNRTHVGIGRMRHPEKQRWRQALKPTATIAKSAAAKPLSNQDSTAPVSRLNLPNQLEQRLASIEARLDLIESFCPFACGANCSRVCPMAVAQ